MELKISWASSKRIANQFNQFFWKNNNEEQHRINGSNTHDYEDKNSPQYTK